MASICRDTPPHVPSWNFDSIDARRSCRRATDPNSKCGIGFFFPSTIFNRSSSSSLAKLFTSGGLEAANIDNRYCASFPRHRPRATLLPRCRGNYYGGLKTRLLLPATKGSPIFGNSFNNRRNNPICPVVENYSSSRRENEIGVSQSF